MANIENSPRPSEGGVDPRNCETCPPDQICAWSCRQGWSVPDILATERLVWEGKLKTPAPPPLGGQEPSKMPEPKGDLLRQAMWECYN